MQSSFEISVVIPNYNRATLLINAIKSALTQTYPILEILVCDDGSTDNSKELVENLNNPKVKWIDCGKNGRPAIPRNIGINQSNGNWIAFLDNDDEWLSTKIYEQVKLIQNTNYLAVSSNAYNINNANNNKNLLLKYTNPEITFTDLIKENNIICSSVLINKQLLIDNRFFPEAIEFKAIEDYVLWLCLSSKINFAYIDKPLLNYLNDSQNSIRKNNSDPYTVEIAFTELENWMEQKNIFLTKDQKQNYSKAKKNVKKRGIPSNWEEFIRKVNFKINKFIKN